MEDPWDHDRAEGERLGRIKSLEAKAKELKDSQIESIGDCLFKMDAALIRRTKDDVFWKTHPMLVRDAAFEWTGILRVQHGSSVHLRHSSQNNTTREIRRKYFIRANTAEVSFALPASEHMKALYEKMTAAKKRLDEVTAERNNLEKEIQSLVDATEKETEKICDDSLEANLVVDKQ